MIPRIKTVPKFYLTKFHEPQITNIPTNELLLKFGFLSSTKPGLNNWMPIGLLILNKLRNIIDRNLEGYAEQVSLSLLTSSELWKRTERWNNTELFKLKDSSNNDYCLSPTSEEEITQLVKNNITSYKDLPVTYYQIHEKFRDEIRPRMGLLRSREFLMKDAYSFSVDEQGALQDYNTMIEVYHNIFNELKVPYVKAVADSGDIGGSLSHEWHYIDETGEDTVFECNHCHNISNIEKTLSLPQKQKSDNTRSVYIRNGDTHLKVLYPETRNFDLKLLKLTYPQAETVGYIPEQYQIVYDSRLTEKGIPVVSAEEHEICYECKQGELSTTRAIEVGHTFYLGTKYSRPLDLSINIPDSNGKVLRQYVRMGCYGIGMTRIIAAIAQINRDTRGFSWPASLSPWTATVIQAPGFKAPIDDIFQDLNTNNIDYRLDDRKLNLSTKIKHSNYVGIPLTIIIGKSYPLVEIEIRGKRYSANAKWRNHYKNSDFEWNAIETNGVDIKHIVHKDGLSTVLRHLLSDM